MTASHGGRHPCSSRPQKEVCSEVFPGLKLAPLAWQTGHEVPETPLGWLSGPLVSSLRRKPPGKVPGCGQPWRTLAPGPEPHLDVREGLEVPSTASIWTPRKRLRRGQAGLASGSLWDF